MITPYENAFGEDPLFLHLYELESDDPVRDTEEMTSQVCEHWAFTETLDILYVDVFKRIDGR